MAFYQLFHLILHEIDRFGCFMLKSGFFSKSLVLCLISLGAILNDVIRGKIVHVAKMATKDEISVDVDFAVCSYKKECFYFISRGIFSFYNVFMGMLS